MKKKINQNSDLSLIGYFQINRAKEMLEISKIRPISTLIPTIIVAKQSTKSSHLHLIYDGAIPFFFSNYKELFSINYVWIWDEFQIFALSSKNDKIDIWSMNQNLFKFHQKIINLPNQ